MFLPFRCKVADQQQYQHGDKDNGGKRIHGWLNAPANLAVYEGRQGVDACAAGKMGDDEVVQRHRKRQQKAGEDAGKDIREHHLEKCLNRTCAQVHRRLISRAAGLLELGHHAQDHIRNIERNMCDQDGLKSQGNPECDKGEHQRDSGHDIGVQHRDVGDSHHDGFWNLFHLIDGDGCRSPDDRGDQSRQKCDRQRIVQGVHDIAAGKHLRVPPQGEPAPLGAGFGAVEGQDHHGSDRGV